MNLIPRSPGPYSPMWMNGILLISAILLPNSTEATSLFHRGGGGGDVKNVGTNLDSDNAEFLSSNSNPFGSGCLRTMIARDEANGKPDRYPLDSPVRKFLQAALDGHYRVCNSDNRHVTNTPGGSHGRTGHEHRNVGKSQFHHCEIYELNYEEVRIAAGNWESSLVLSWIYQILLSEIFEVPTTIENGDGKRDPKSSFYDPQNRFTFPDQVYPVEHLIEADRLDGNCNLSNKACAHILPEVWDGAQNQDVLNGQLAGSVLPEESNGVVGNIGYYISMYTAQKFPSLMSYIGLQGEHNRKKLASIFKTPTTWLHYCEHISENNCTIVGGDGVAMEYPIETKHKNSYFVEGLYNGHFRVAESNNCTSNPDCVGHVATPHCSWTIFTENQMYWNNISLSNSGPELPNRGYSIESMVEIWKAANATNSDVFFWWWTPEILLEKYVGTPFAFQRVAFPAVTEECLQYRNKELSGSRCSDDPLERIGEKIGSCDYAAVPVKKVMSVGLRTSAYSVPEARRSPAFEFLKQIYMPQYSLTNILRHFEPNQPREAVCEWVYDNLETLLRYAPTGYPKDASIHEYHALTYSAYVFAGIALFCTIMIAAFTYRWREHHILKITQLDVLACILFGYGLLALASFLGASEPSNITCTATQWMIRLGYTLQFVPILIKVSAINKITRLGRRLRRAQINPHRFKRIVALAVSFVIVFLIVWTLLDPALRHEVVTNGDEEDAVNVHIGCASQSVIWEIAAYSWECILLLATTVLTFQSRDLMKELNESHSLAFMVYSHFLFLLMRVAAYILMFNHVITSAMTSKVVAIFLSFDSIAAVSIYVWPKIFEVANNKSDPRRMTTTMRISRNSARRSFISGITLPDGKVPNLIRPSMVSRGENPAQRRISGISIPSNGIPNLIRPKDRVASDIAKAVANLSSSVISDTASNHDRQKSSSVNFSSIYMGCSSDDEEEDTDEVALMSSSSQHKQMASKIILSVTKEEDDKDEKDSNDAVKDQELAQLKSAMQELEDKYNLLRKENDELKKQN